MQITKPVIKLTSFHLCGKKPTAKIDEPVAEMNESKSKRKNLPSKKLEKAGTGSPCFSLVVILLLKEVRSKL